MVRGRRHGTAAKHFRALFHAAQVVAAYDFLVLLDQDHPRRKLCRIIAEAEYFTGDPSAIERRVDRALARRDYLMQIEQVYPLLRDAKAKLARLLRKRPAARRACKKAVARIKFFEPQLWARASVNIPNRRP